MSSSCSLCCLIYGLIAFVACSALYGIWTYFIRKGKDLTSYGSWAVVTGATDGIGKEYASQLAALGINVCLISRTLSKLEDTAKEIKEKSNVEVKIVVADFSKGKELKDHISAELKGLDIGILVNNVGLSYEYPEYFMEVPEERVWQIIELNITSMVMMTRLVLPEMISKKKGLIINISSFTSVVPCGLLTVYSAAKAFANTFSQALNQEYGPSGVTVQTVTPMLVSTKMSKIRRASITVPTPKAYVQSALRTAGTDSITTGYWSHAALAWPTNFLPTVAQTTPLFKMHKGIRASALRKKKST